MPKWMAALLLALSLLFPGWAQAQGNPISLEKVEVDLWPEYDRPDVLVIYHIFLPADTSLPANVTLPIPAAVGDPYNLAVREADGNMYNLTFNRTVKGAWGEVNFSTPGTEIQLEYYNTDLKKAGSQRSFTYLWPASYAVKSFNVQIQRPVGASQMQINPPLTASGSGEGDLQYYSGEIGSLAADQDFSLSLQYQKPNDSLSIELMKVQPAGPVNNQTPGRLTLSDYLPWILGVLAFSLIIGGAIWYWRSGRAPQPAEERRRHAATGRSRPAEKIIDSSDGMYCHQCGKRALAGDVFCRSCGARLRKE